MPGLWFNLLGRAKNTEKAAASTTQNQEGVRQMTQEEWDALNLKEIPCPKCGQAGFLVSKGQDDYGHFIAKCRRHPKDKVTGCGRQSAESLIMQQVGKSPAKSTPKAKHGNNNNPSIAQLQDDVNELKKMLAQLLGTQAIEVIPEPVAFKWDDYSEDQQIKIQQLIGILREHPKWGSYKLQKELQSLKMGIRMGDIIKVKNAFKKGVFNEN